MNLKNKVALVTGGAARVGKSISESLSAKGCKVIVHYNNSKTQAVRTIESMRRRGAEGIIVKADITVDADVDSLLARSEEKYGHIDILVNNAGLFFRTPIDSLQYKDWRQILDVNVHGTSRCARKIGLHMRNRGTGHIINVADVAGQTPWRDYIPYSVSKACILAMNQGLAIELAPHVMVNAVVPGPMLFGPNTGEEIKNGVIARTLLKRGGRPQDVGDLVVFIAESTFSTGAVFSVDGGRGLT